MFSLVIPLVEDEDDTVRNNAVFALGEIAFYGKESVYKLVFKISYALFIFNLEGVALVFFLIFSGLIFTIKTKYLEDMLICYTDICCFHQTSV